MHDQGRARGRCLFERSGFRLRVSGRSRIFITETAFGAAVHEYQFARFERIGLEPAWWNDQETLVEGFTLKHGNAYLVNVISHHAEVRDIPVSVDRSEMGFAPGEPVFAWQHQARAVLIAGSQYDDAVPGHDTHGSS